MMRQLGGGPGGAGMGLLSRLPGFRQLAQLKSLKGMNPNELASMFGLPEAMGNNLPAAGGKGSHAAAVARQRLMGYGPPTRVVSDEEKDRLRDKRKKERQNKKKARKKR
jgi:signal recognition particle subunit SRP54